MRILVAGDTHGDLDHVEYLFEKATELNISTIVQVGDFGYWPHKSNFHLEVDKLAVQHEVDFYWLDGNHENFDMLEQAVDTTSTVPVSMGERLVYLPRGCTWEWDGVRFMALGSGYSIDKELRTEGVSWWRQETLTTAEVLRAMDQGEVDILLSHDMPGETFNEMAKSRTWWSPIKESAANRRAVDAVIESAKPRLIIHGHMHVWNESKLSNGTQVISLDMNGTASRSWVILNTEDWKNQCKT